jgi:TRAP-type C4-dicarboxylate transport system permease small subunit
MGVQVKSIERVLSGLTMVLGVLLILGVGLNFLNAALRYSGGGSLFWAEEIMVYGMIFVIMIGSVIATAKDDHLRMDVIVQWAGPVARKWLLVISHLALVLSCGFLAWNSHTVVSMMLRLGQQSVAARIPMWIPHGIVFVALVLCTVVGVLRAVHTLLQKPVASAEVAA